MKPPQLTTNKLERLAYLRSLKPARSASLRSSSRGDRIANLVRDREIADLHQLIKTQSETIARIEKMLLHQNDTRASRALA